MPIDLYSLDELNSIGNAAVKTNLPELDPTIPGSMVRTLVSANSILIFAAQRNIQAALDDFFPQRLCHLNNFLFIFFQFGFGVL